MKKIIIGRNGYISQSYLNRHPLTLSTTSTDYFDDLYLNLEDIEKFNWGSITSDTIVYMLASISSPDICSKQYEFAYNINVRGTIKFITKTLELGAKVVFFSSDTVYGECNSHVTETSETSPVGAYGEMKLCVEKEFLEHPNFKVFRLSYVFSRKDKFTQYLLESVEKSQKIDVFDPFDRAIVYIDDVVLAMENIANLWHKIGSIINICGPELISKKQLVIYFNKFNRKPIEYKIVKPEESFFLNRPKIINVKSEVMPVLLSSKWTKIEDAMKKEL